MKSLESHVIEICCIHQTQLVPTFTPDIKDCSTPKIGAIVRSTTSEDFTKQISVDPDNMFSPELKLKFHALHKECNQVFNTKHEGYNHSYGKFEDVVNMGNVKPPKRKGKLLQYSRDKLSTVQYHFDKLEELGVLAKPDTIGRGGYNFAFFTLVNYPFYKSCHMT